MLFRPPLAEMMALSPDGQRVAYTVRTARDLTIVIMNVEPPGPKRKVPVAPERDTDTPVKPIDAADIVNADEPPPPQLRFLRWASNTRLVFAPFERIVPLPAVTDRLGHTAPNPDGPVILSPIMVADAEGRQRGTVIDARNFQETPAEARHSLADLLRTPQELAATRHEAVRWRMPHLELVGFLPEDREQLIIETRGAYSIPTQHLVDLRTGSVREFGGDWSVPPGEPQVFDWFRLKVVGERQPAAAHPTTTWRDEDLGRVQQELVRKFPHRIVELLDWSDTRARGLFRVTGGSDAGRVFVYQRMEDLVLEILSCAPWLGPAKLNETRAFEFAASDGAQLSGYFTWPRQPRVEPPPLLVIFASGFPGHAQPAFDPEAQAFADLGFAVARLNHRSVGGVRAGDRAALSTAPDRVPVDDARAALDWIATRYPDHAFDRKRVATLGRGFGGYLALRALQLQPAVFHCGVALDAPLDPRALESHDIPPVPAGDEPTNAKRPSVLDDADALTNPVLLLAEPARDPAIDAATEELRARLQQLGRPPEQFPLEAGFAAAQPAARAAAYRKIGEFLDAHLIKYAVKIGPTKEVP